MINKKIKIDYPYEVKTFIEEYLKASPSSSCHVLIYHGFIKKSEAIYAKGKILYMDSFKYLKYYRYALIKHVKIDYCHDIKIWI